MDQVTEGSLLTAGWRTLDPGLVAEMVLRIKGQLDRQNELNAIQLKQLKPENVATVRTRGELACYPGFELYEIEFKLHPKLDQGYTSATMFVLLGAHRALLLNGKSPPIHEFNAIGGADGKSPLKLETDAAYLEYLRFFTTFVVGDEGPFLLVESEADLLWRPQKGDTAERADETFDKIVARRRKEFGWQTLTHIDSAVLKSFIEATDRERALKDLREALPKYVSSDDREAEPEPLGKVEFIKASIKGDHEREAGSKLAEGTVNYGRALFHAEFSIAKTGMIEMLSDTPIAADLQVLGRVFDEEQAVLLAEGTPNRMEPEDFAALLRADDDAEIEYVRIPGNIDLSGASIPGRTRLVRVEIDGDLILDDARIDRSIELHRVHIRGRLHAKDTAFGGSVRIIDVSVDGCYEPGLRSARDTVALSLKGARIASALDLSRSHVQGGIDLDAIDVAGSATFLGLALDLAHERTPRTDRGLTAQRGTFKRGLSMRPSEAGLSRKLSRINGPLDLAGSTIDGDLELNGLECASFIRVPIQALPWVENALRPVMAGENPEAFWDAKTEEIRLKVPSAQSIGINAYYTQPGDMTLANATIGGQLSAPQIHAEDLTLVSAKIARNVNVSFAHLGGLLNGQWISVKDSLHANSIKASNVYLSGSKIGASLSLSGSDIKGDVLCSSCSIAQMLDGNPAGDARTSIGGKIDLSGSDIGSDVRFSAAKIAGTLTMFTGSTGRIQVSAKLIGGQFIPTEIGGLLLQQVTTGSFSAYALVVGSEREAEDLGSFEIRESTINGSLSFFSERPDISLLYGLTGEPRKQLAASLPDCAKVRPSIKNKLTLTGLTVTGEVNLSNLDVANGEIDLSRTKSEKLTAKARIADENREGYVNAGGKCESSELVLSCKSLTLDRHVCAGDVELTGLDKAEFVVAKRAKVNGELVIADRKDKRGASGHRTFYDLDGAEVGRLRLEGDPLHSANLINLKITQVDRDQLRIVSQMLWAAKTFDRRQYVEFEDSLWNQGFHVESKAIHRQMMWHELQPERKPHSNPQIDTIYRRLSLAFAVTFPLLFLSAALAGAILESYVAAVLAFVGFLIAGAWLRWPRKASGATIGILTGFWTRSARMLRWLAPTWLLSALIFASPSNVAPTTLRLGESTDIISRATPPTKSEWTNFEYVRLLVSMHVPIIQLIEGERWEPSDRPICLPNELKAPRWELPDGHCKKGEEWALSGGLTASAYGLLVKILHWIAWPLFLIGVTMEIQRSNRHKE